MCLLKPTAATSYGASSHLHLTRLFVRLILSRGSSLFTHSRGATANAKATVKATVLMHPLISCLWVFNLLFTWL